ncbi:DUF317 domain-containing protein [Kitasatospora sp. NPDC052896]|uniref:DUF317 domain-containing protein n=1 Tax=Kitasatospora sp. NPDC052896 TaxID=3364061 RepID=UPI0037CBDC52
MNLTPPDPQMLVRPVYLAGHGDPELITGPLEAAPGWGKAVTNAGTHYVSPCQTVHIAHVPGSWYGGWKVLAHREPLGPPVWAASFTRNTPAEITSAFTTTLVDGLRSNHRDYLNGGSKFQPPSPAGALADRGWITDNEAQQYLYQRAPEGHAAFRMRKFHLDEEAELLEQGPPQWTLHACVERENGERWHADFTGSTPLYLVREAVVAFSSTNPVVRALLAVPERNLSYVRMRRVPEAAAPRQSAALARTAQPRQPGPAPAAPPTTASAAATATHRR